MFGNVLSFSEMGGENIGVHEKKTQLNVALVRQIKQTTVRGKIFKKWHC